MVRGSAAKCVWSEFSQNVTNVLDEFWWDETTTVCNPLLFSCTRVMYKLPVSSRGQIKSRSVDKLFLVWTKMKIVHLCKSFNKVKHRNNVELFWIKLRGRLISVQTLFRNISSKWLFVLAWCHQFYFIGYSDKLVLKTILGQKKGNLKVVKLSTQLWINFFVARETVPRLEFQSFWKVLIM